MLPLCGVPLAQFAVDSCLEAGVQRVAVNLHHQPEQTRKGLADLDWQSTQLSWSDESALLLGSAGGLRKGLSVLGGQEPFFFLNTDTLCDLDLRALEATHQRLRRQWGVMLTLAVFPSGPTPGRYREIQLDRSRQLITGVSEPVSGRPFFTGVGVIEPEALSGLALDQPSEFLPAILEPAVRAGRAGVHLAQGAWHDVGSPELWWRTHLEMVQSMETGTLPLHWRKRLDRTCRRLGQGVWGLHGVHSGAEWAGPSFAGCNSEFIVGPRAVIYSKSPAFPLQNGIYYDGILTRFDSVSGGSTPSLHQG